jgi:hypothetical protein
MPPPTGLPAWGRKLELPGLAASGPGAGGSGAEAAKRRRTLPPRAARAAGRRRPAWRGSEQSQRPAVTGPARGRTQRGRARQDATGRDTARATARRGRWQHPRTRTPTSPPSATGSRSPREPATEARSLRPALAVSLGWRGRLSLHTRHGRTGRGDSEATGKLRLTALARYNTPLVATT